MLRYHLCKNKPDPNPTKPHSWTQTYTSVTVQNKAWEEIPQIVYCDYSLWRRERDWLAEKGTSASVLLACFQDVAVYNS